MRGKANAEIEFGNKLTIIESWQGMILDYQLHASNRAKSNHVESCIERIKAKHLKIKKLWGDRGMFSR